MSPIGHVLDMIEWCPTRSVHRPADFAELHYKVKELLNNASDYSIHHLHDHIEVRVHDWMIDFENISSHLGLFPTKRLGDRIYCTFIFILFVYLYCWNSDSHLVFSCVKQKVYFLSNKAETRTKSTLVAVNIFLTYWLFLCCNWRTSL